MSELSGEQPAGEQTSAGIANDQTPVTTEPKFDDSGNPIEDNPADEDEEVDFDGKKFRGPKGLKDAILRQADYTVKTQAVAERGRTLEEREKSFSEQARLHQEHLADVGRVYAINEKVQQWEKAFKEPGWAQFEQANPGQAQALFRQYLLDKDALRDAAGGLQQKINMRSQEAQRESAKRVEEAHSVVAREIKDWPAVRDKATDFAVSQLGFKPDEIKGLDDPRTIKALHLAYVGAQAIKREAAARKAAASEDAQPIRAVGSNSGAIARKPTDPSGDKLSDAEWVARRNEQLRKK